MKVFITGATGFIGGKTAELLVASGHTVRALVRSPKKAAKLEKLGVELVAGDLGDAEAIAKGVRGCDGVLHIAGLLFESYGGEFADVNIAGTRRVLEAAKHAGGVSRFVFVSSIAAAGPAKFGTPLTEDMPCAPVSAYGRTKRDAEALVRAFSEHFEVSIVRPPVVYGPGDTSTLPIFKIAKLGLAPSVGFEAQTTSLVHVNDLARGLIDVLTHKNGGNDTFYLAERAIPSTAEFVGAIGEALGKGKLRSFHVPNAVAWGAAYAAAGFGALLKKPQVFNPDKLAEMMSESWGCSAARARERLGFEESVDYREGVLQAARWYEEAGWI